MFLYHPNRECAPSDRHTHRGLVPSSPRSPHRAQRSSRPVPHPPPPPAQAHPSSSAAALQRTASATATWLLQRRPAATRRRRLPLERGNAPKPAVRARSALSQQMTRILPFGPHALDAAAPGPGHGRSAQGPLFLSSAQDGPRIYGVGPNSGSTLAYYGPSRP